MMRYLLAVLAMMAATVTPAAAQSACGPKQELLGIVTGEKYHEAPFLTLDTKKGLIRLFVNLGTGTWSLINFPAAAPHLACLIAGGTGIERSALPMKFKGDPA